MPFFEVVCVLPTYARLRSKYSKSFLFACLLLSGGDRGGEMVGWWFGVRVCLKVKFYDESLNLYAGRGGLPFAVTAALKIQPNKLCTG